LTSQLLLDGQQRVESRAGGELRLPRRRRVQKHRLRSRHIDRVGVIERRDAQMRHGWSERLNSTAQMCFAISEIASECDGDSAAQRSVLSAQGFGTTSDVLALRPES